MYTRTANITAEAKTQCEMLEIRRRFPQNIHSEKIRWVHFIICHWVQLLHLKIAGPWEPSSLMHSQLLQNFIYVTIIHNSNALALVLKQPSCVEGFVYEVETVIIVDLWVHYKNEKRNLSASFCIMFWFHNFTAKEFSDIFRWTLNTSKYINFKSKPPF